LVRDCRLLTNSSDEWATHDLEAVVSNTGGQVELRGVQFRNSRGWLNHSSDQRILVDAARARASKKNAAARQPG
jgi:hypothetical protein